MKKTWKSSVLLIGTAMLGAVALSGMNAMAGDVDMDVDVVVATTLVETPTTPLNFGSIDLNPGGDTVTIDCSATDTTAATGETPTALSGSIFTGGASGLVTIESVNAFEIAVTYPVSVTLIGSGTAAGAPDLSLTQIAAKSSGGAGNVIKAVTVDSNIHVGGVIVFPANTQNGAYHGVMNIIFNYSS